MVDLIKFIQSARVCRYVDVVLGELRIHVHSERRYAAHEKDRGQTRDARNLHFFHPASCDSSEEKSSKLVCYRG